MSPSESQVRVKQEQKKIKMRQAHKVEGVFETGVDVVEHEYDVNQINSV
jgi:hypothetical protein